MAINLLRDERVSLAADEEWRFEVDYGAQAAVTLKEGLAEIFGTELVRDRRYTFSGVKLAVFTWHGCSLEVEGAFSHQYIARETPMLGVLKFHEELEQRRSAALAALGRGPRVMVVGSDDCGKSTLCRILANYAARRSHGTTFVDLDVGQQLCGLTGSVSAVAWHAPFDLELGAEYAAPLAFWVGHVRASEQVALYRHSVGRLAAELDQLEKEHIGARTSGIIVNTSGWVDGDGYEALIHAAEVLHVDTIVVIADDRLYSRLTGHFSHKSLTVMRVPKSGGVVVREKSFKHEGRMEQLRTYFYGHNGQLCPHSTVVQLSAVTLLVIDEAPAPPADTLPIGTIVQRHVLRVVKAPISHWISLLKSVLAVSLAQSADQDEVLAAPIAGMVYVTHVDVDGGRATLLAPSPAALPSTVIICGAIKWLETGR